jgi:hypothetical protein
MQAVRREVLFATYYILISVSSPSIPLPSPSPNPLSLSLYFPRKSYLHIKILEIKVLYPGYKVLHAIML